MGHSEPGSSKSMCLIENRLLSMYRALFRSLIDYLFGRCDIFGNPRSSRLAHLRVFLRKSFDFERIVRHFPSLLEFDRVLGFFEAQGRRRIALKKDVRDRQSTYAWKNQWWKTGQDGKGILCSDEAFSKKSFD